MDVARQILAVMVVFALLGGAVWALRRGSAGARAAGGAGWLRVAGESMFRSPASPAPAMERVGRLALTPQHTLHLVRVQGRDMVVATHPQGCSVVQAGLAANSAVRPVTTQAAIEANA
jgi:flagellar biogenesis protein FliO